MSANNTTDIEAIRAAERIYHEWDEALGRKDIDAALKLYAPDAVLESPLVLIFSAAPRVSSAAVTISAVSLKRSSSVRRRYGNATAMDFSRMAKD